MCEIVSDVAIYFHAILIWSSSVATPSESIKNKLMQLEFQWTKQKQATYFEIGEVSISLLSSNVPNVMGYFDENMRK